MNIQRLLLLLLEFFDPLVYGMVGIVIGYMIAMVVYEFCNPRRISEVDLLRWQNDQLLTAIETYLQSPGCNAAAAPKPSIASLVAVRATSDHKEK